MFNIIILPMCKYSFQLYYTYVYTFIACMCISVITLISDVQLLYLINVYTYMSFIIIVWFNSFICIKIIAETTMTNRIKGLQNIQILGSLFILCYTRIWQ